MEVRFVAQEVDFPHAISIVAFTNYSIELADKEITAAQKKWADCLASDTWAGYVHGIVCLDCPEYLTAQREQRSAVEGT